MRPERFRSEQQILNRFKFNTSRSLREDRRP